MKCECCGQEIPRKMVKVNYRRDKVGRPVQPDSKYGGNEIYQQSYYLDDTYIKHGKRYIKFVIGHGEWLELEAHEVK